MKRMCRFVLIAVSFVGLARAGTLAVDFSSVTVNFTNYSWSLGWQFDVKSPIWVTRLGFYDDLKDGLTQSHAVGIWDSSATLLVSAVVSPSDPLVSWWRWTTLATPLLLTPGADYRIAAVTGVENYTWNPVGFVVAPDITFVIGRWSGPTTSLDYPSGYSPEVGIFGPNFEYEAEFVIPEPSTLALVMLGAVVLGLLRPRRAKAG